MYLQCLLSVAVGLFYVVRENWVDLNFGNSEDGNSREHKMVSVSEKQSAHVIKNS